MKLFGVDAANVVLPVMYTLLPSLADITILRMTGANDAGFLALFSVMVLELLVADGYNDEKMTISTPKLASKLSVHCAPQTAVVLEVRKLERVNGPHGVNCSCTTEPA